MVLLRRVVPALVAGLVWTLPLGAQEATGSISGVAIDSTTLQPIPGVNIAVVGTPRATVTANDGSFLLSAVPAGSYTLRAIRIGYAPRQQAVTVTGGATATVQLALTPQAALIAPVVVTGYGAQRREAITGSVSQVNADAADVGVVPNVDRMIQGRAAGVEIVTNNGEPGAGVQIRIRGGTSINASNEPLYVIDGVPIYNQETEASGFNIGGRTPALPRNPLNLINPSDIGSITILKDAAATAIYGSRAANGVILIETRQGTPGAASVEYDGFVGMASPTRYLDVLNGDQYRTFVQEQVALWKQDSIANIPVASRRGLASSHLATLDTANTDWERAVTRSSVTHDQNISFSGGGADTRYRASLNYMDQQGVVENNGFKRVQGRLNATHEALNDRVRLGVNVTASQVDNKYIEFENTGGFEGGVFENVATFNPTHPVTVKNALGQITYYEIGPGLQSVRNPAALVNQLQDEGTTTRALGNAKAELDVTTGLTASVNVGVDRSNGTRRMYFPSTNPIGAQYNGMARQSDRDNTTVTLQTLLTLQRTLSDVHSFDVVGGYEFSELTSSFFQAEARNFLTDAFSFDNLGAGAVQVTPVSWRSKERLASFFGRANYGYKDKYFLTGVVRRDGSSKFGEGHKWALFPAVSASWHLSAEDFMRNAPLSLSDLRLRVGYGLQGNPGLPAYSSLATLDPSTGASYPWGDVPFTGVAPSRNPNPNLKWEQAAQFNIALDYGFRENRISGTIEYYVKNTKDLLLQVSVPQPASVSSRYENVGKVRNKGLEISIDAVPLSRPNLTWRAGLVFTAGSQSVVDLGPYTFIRTGDVSGQGQSDQFSQRILPGHPLGTFYGPVFVGVNAQGQQLFRCHSLGVGDTLPNGSQACVNGQMTTARASDYAVLGNANPDFTIGLTSQIGWKKFDLSFLIRAEVGQDVFNNTALVYSTKGNAKQDKNFLVSALSDPTGINEPAIFSSRWVEGASFLRLQNVTIGYSFTLPGSGRSARAYVSGDNLLLFTGYSGLDPEVHVEAFAASRGTDYLTYPRPRTITGGLRVAF